MLAVPFNGDLTVVDYASNMAVKEFYGQLRLDSFGGGRTPFGYPEIDENILQEAILKAHSNNITFNYTMNFLSLANMEFDRGVQLKLLSFIDTLVALGVDSLTVANPFFIPIIKANFPRLMISVSVVANAECLEQIELFASLGAQRVVLSKSLNKDIQALTRLTKSTSVELQLIVNDPCLQYCPFRTYHNIVSSFSSMHLLQVNKHLSFCTMMCRKTFLEKPYKLVKSTYIRPEDLERYRRIGITNFKLVDRKESTPWLKRAILAYHNESYNGNLADLCSFFSPVKGKGEIDHNPELRRLSIDEITSIESIDKFKNNLRFKPFLDNKKLAQHIEPLLNMQCRETDCDKCGFCAKVFTEVGHIDETQRQIVLFNINQVMKAISRRDF
jgi:collagenase-like PrtC family protease